MKKGHSILIAAAIAGALGTLHSFTAAAQAADISPADAPPASTAPADALPSRAQPAPAVDEKKLDQFATAYVKIQTLQKDAATKPPAADPAAAQNELQSKMAEAVQQSGLDVAEFNTIAQAMVSDTDLRTRIQIKVEEHSKSGG